MKALVLAGGFPQIALLNELKSRNIETILADYYETTVAKEYADDKFVIYRTRYQFLNLSSIVTLLIQVLFGVLIYVGLSFIFKLESFKYLLSVFKKRN